MDQIAVATPSPSLVNCVLYGGDGRKLRDIRVDEISEALQDAKSFVWVGLHEPDEPMLDLLQREFGLHELTVEDIHSAHQRTKIEAYGEALFIAVHTAQMQGDKIQFGETHLILGHNYLVSIRHGASLSYAPARRSCETSPSQLALGPSYAMYAVLDFIIDNYMPIVADFQTRLHELEHTILGSEFNQHTIVQLYELKKELVQLQLAMTPMQDIMSQLVRLYPGLVRDKVRPYFRDVGDHAARINESAGAMREMLTTAMEVNLALVGVAQNVVLKRIAGWGLLFTAPTLFASWYGMNFHDMPELVARHGYLIAFGCAVAMCIVLYVFLRRAKWL